MKCYVAKMEVLVSGCQQCQKIINCLAMAFTYLTFVSNTDLTDLLKDEINGPATFKCTNGDCAFSGMFMPIALFSSYIITHVAI
jgi:hypothetical protein